MLMRFTARIVLLTALAVLTAVAPGLAAGAASDDTGERRLLIISIDGLKWETIQTQWPRLPTLGALAADGVHGSATTIFPSMTWPSHTSIITGSLPRRHGVLGNRIWDHRKRQVLHASNIPKEELIRVPTLYDVAAQAGLSTAGIMWPATRDASTLPVNLVEAYSQKKFEKYSSPGLLAELARQGLPSDRLGYYNKKSAFFFDSYIRDAALHTLAKDAPRLMLVHFLAVDTVSHSRGPESREVLWTLELVDRYVADILKRYESLGIRDQTDVMIVSDHGFMQIDRKLDADRLLHEAGLIRKLKKLDKGPVRTVFNGHALYIYVLDRKKVRSTIKEVIKIFRPFKGQELKRIIKPRQFHNYGLATAKEHPHAPDLILLSAPNALFQKVKGKGKKLRGPSNSGMHGYLPDHPAMKTTFIAAGPSIKQRREPLDIRNIDIAPTAAAILGITFPEPIDGVVMHEVLRHAPASTPKVVPVAP